MAKNFQVDRNKNKNGQNDIYKQSTKQNNTTEILTKNHKLREGFKKWTAYFRANPHRFCSEYLGINLHLFQKLLVYMCFRVDFLMYIAARGQGKSWLIAVICCVRCILYPNTKIILASGTKGQARLIITQKIEQILMEQFPNLKREIRNVKTGTNECIVFFQNGSTIEAVTSTDNARGYRGNMLVLDEFRLIDKDMLDKVLRMFLTVNRQPPYLKKAEYAHLTEENKEIYISSAWYKNHWIWDKFKSFTNSMCNMKDYFVCGLPYKLSMHHGLLSKKRVEAMKTEEDYDAITWLMEMDCLFFGESENAFFKLAELDKNRTIIKPFYPMSDLDFIQNKDKKKKTTKQKGEIRIIGADVALMGGEKNDNTIFVCMRLLPNGEYYVKYVPYMESIMGQHTEKQAIRLKQLYNDFEADFVAMDTMGNGMSLYDDCARILYDEKRDVEYPAWSALNNEEMKNRALDKNALPVIFSVKADASINHEIALYLRTSLEKKTLRLLIGDIQGRDYLIDKLNYNEKSPEEQVFLSKPYIQTTMLINEMVNLEFDINRSQVKVYEIGRNRKDRYSSLAYCNYYAKILELKLKKKTTKGNPLDFFFMRKPRIYG